jgi:hypothetical protein
MSTSATGPTAAAPEPSGAAAPEPGADPDTGTDTAAEQGTSEQDAVPLNRAERRARAKAEAAGSRTGPPPDRTLRRGRGPRSHTKRI